MENQESTKPQHKENSEQDDEDRRVSHRVGSFLVFGPIHPISVQVFLMLVTANRQNHMRKQVFAAVFHLKKFLTKRRT